MDLKSFAALLAQRQGGVLLRPGYSCRINLTGAEVKKIFGEGAVAYASETLTITIDYLPDNEASVEIRRNL